MPEPETVPERRSKLLSVRPGLCSVTLRHLLVAEVAEVAAAAGLKGIEWGGDVHVPPGDDAAARAARRECERRGLVCASYGSYLRAGELDAAELRKVLDTAQLLGATNVRVWCRWLAVADATLEDRRAIAADLARIAASALAQGMTVSVEFHPYTLTETAASAIELIEGVGAPNLFTYWQPATGLDIASLLGELAAVREHLSHLHVFRWEDVSTRRPLSEGEELWIPALAASRRPGRWVGSRWALLEFVRDDDPEQVVRDAAALRSWLGLGPAHQG